MALIEDRDIFNIVAYEYLDMKDLINLDTAIVEDGERARFLELLETVPYKPPFHDNLEKWWRNHKKCLQWLCARKMFTPEGEPWHVNKKLWESLLNDTTQDYKPFLSKLKDVFFEGFGSPYNLAGFEICESLEKVQLCNYNAPEAASPAPTCPSLKHLILQNSKICDVTLRNFMNVSTLKQLSLRHVQYETLSEEVLNHYLETLQEVSVLNRVTEFFTNFAKRPNRIEVASFDMLHTGQNTEFDMEPFLKQSPHLRELHIVRMCVDVQTVFELIAKYCPHLEYLHLNHVRLAVNGSSNGRTFDGEIPFTRLKISTFIPPFDEHYNNVLTMTRGKIRHLHLSYCERLTDGGYMQIRDLCPHLQIFELDEKRELFEGEGEKAGRVERIVGYFDAAVPNIKVTLWNRWLAENLKEKYVAEREVKFVKGTF